MKYIKTMNLVAFCNWKVETDYGEGVWFGNTKWRVQTSNKVRHLIECDELGGVGIKPENFSFSKYYFNTFSLFILLGPFSIKHLKILLNNSYFFFLMCLIEILKDDSNVHVDHNHEVDNDERHKINNGYKREAAVSIWKVFIIWITVGRLGHQRV